MVWTGSKASTAAVLKAVDALDDGGLKICDICFQSEAAPFIDETGDEPLAIVKRDDGLWYCKNCDVTPPAPSEGGESGKVGG